MIGFGVGVYTVERQCCAGSGRGQKVRDNLCLGPDISKVP